MIKCYLGTHHKELHTTTCNPPTVFCCWKHGFTYIIHGTIVCFVITWIVYNGRLGLFNWMDVKVEVGGQTMLSTGPTTVGSDVNLIYMLINLMKCLDNSYYSISCLIGI